MNKKNFSLLIGFLGKKHFSNIVSARASKMAERANKQDKPAKTTAKKCGYCPKPVL